MHKEERGKTMSDDKGNNSNVDVVNKLKEKIRAMSIDDIIDKLQCANQGPTYFAICENDDGHYALDEWFDAQTLSQIICVGAFKDFAEGDFIEGSYLCIWAQMGYKLSEVEAEAKICRSEDEVKAYIMQLIDEDALDDILDEDDIDEEDEEEDDYE